MISLYIPGVPVPQGAVKTFIAGGKARGRHSNAKELQDYRARIAMAARAAVGDVPPIDGPVALEVWFFLPRPRSHFGTGRNAGVVKSSAPPCPTTRPDLSHLVRALEDGLTGVLLRDDSVIVAIQAIKEYDCIPRTEIKVRQVVKRSAA
jgi:Holliday junction resolvase RusA-like endonuclease